MPFRQEEVLKKECRFALSDSFTPAVKQPKALTRSSRAVCERWSDEWSLYGANRQIVPDITREPRQESQI
jgi:hypothetical protein